MVIIPVASVGWGLGPSLLYLFGMLGALIWVLYLTSEQGRQYHSNKLSSKQPTEKVMKKRLSKKAMTEDEKNSLFLEALKKDAKERFK